MLSFIFIIITLLSLILFYYGTGRDKRVLLVNVVWIIVVGILSFSGYFENTSAKPPRFLLVLSGAILLSVFLFKRLKNNRPDVKPLLALHSLRMLIELVLYQLFLQHKIPVLMTFKGWNFDILMGISAIFILLYLLLTKKKISRSFFLIWNISGLVLLTIIVFIAILSSPLPLQQLAFDQPNIALLQFPFSFLPACIVPFVFLTHIFMLRTAWINDASKNNF